MSAVELLLLQILLRFIRGWNRVIGWQVRSVQHLSDYIQRRLDRGRRW